MLQFVHMVHFEGLLNWPADRLGQTQSRLLTLNAWGSNLLTLNFFWDLFGWALFGCRATRCQYFVDWKMELDHHWICCSNEKQTSKASFWTWVDVIMGPFAVHRARLSSTFSLARHLQCIDCCKDFGSTCQEPLCQVMASAHRSQTVLWRSVVFSG